MSEDDPPGSGSGRSRFLDERLARLDAPSVPIHRALVLGATGGVGGALLEALVSRKVSVRAMRRWGSSERAMERWGQRQGVQWVVGDVTQRETLVSAMGGCTVAFHVAAVLDDGLEGPAAIAAAVDSMRNVLDAAAEAHLARLVVVGTAHTVDGTPAAGGQMDESCRYLPGGGEHWSFEARYRVELEVLRAAAVGLPVVLVNPTLCAGAGAVLGQPERWPQAFVGGGAPRVRDGVVNVIDVRDVAAALVEAAVRGRSGQRYILAGHDLTGAQLWARLEALGVKGGLGQRAGALVGASRWALEPWAGAIGRRAGFGARRASAQLGLSPRSLEETLEGIFGGRA